MGMTFSSLALCQKGFALPDTLSQNDGVYLSPSPYLGTGLVSLSKELASYVFFHPEHSRLNSEIFSNSGKNRSCSLFSLVPLVHTAWICVMPWK